MTPIFTYTVPTKDTIPKFVQALWKLAQNILDIHNQTSVNIPLIRRSPELLKSWVCYYFYWKCCNKSLSTILITFIVLFYSFSYYYFHYQLNYYYFRCFSLQFKLCLFYWKITKAYTFIANKGILEVLKISKSFIGCWHQGRSQPNGPGWARFPLSSFFLKFWSFWFIFPQNFLIFFLILALRVGDLPTGKALATLLAGTLRQPLGPML